MGFPNDRDRALIRQSQAAEDLAIELSNWVAEYNPDRKEQDLAPIAESDEFELFRLRRQATNLYSSARVPVAAAVYGPSQVGKSLFVGQLLKPDSENYSPLGRDEQNGEPAYYQHLSFDDDLNPQSGSNEATALVTRFTTKDRLPSTSAPEYPVMVRGLTRSQWLRVLGRGFLVECKTPDTSWEEGELEELFVDLSSQYRSSEVDRRWRMDLLDAYSYMRTCDRRGFVAKESVLNGLLSRYPLSEEGYVAAAASLFWNGWDSLTSLFNRINHFLDRLTKDGRDPYILTHWAGTRFLLDSQRAKMHERRNSKCFKKVEWKDFTLVDRDGWFILEYHPGRGGGNEDLETIQAAMLELVMPILPHRLNEDWRRTIEQMDILDVPGMRAGRQGAEEGKRTSAETLQEQMEIVKRGKVAYLFERYTEELQIQTLLLLARGGNLEVTAQMKFHMDKWGRARYGEKVWPSKVRDELPALFVGMTGIDEEFRNREEYADRMLYETRLAQLADALGDVMNDFGSKGQSFTNVYPIRYPGTWDTDEEQRNEGDPSKWKHAGDAFVEAENVQQYVKDAREKWDAAMEDSDGGLSLISAGFRHVTTADKKQDQLQQEINEVYHRLMQLAKGWTIDPDANLDRQRRIECARRVLDWLSKDPQLVYNRVQAMEEALSLQKGDEMNLADFVDMRQTTAGRPDALEKRFPRHLKEYLQEWATSVAPKNWEEHTSTQAEGGPWLGLDEFTEFARYLKDYLISDNVFGDFNSRLLPVVGLKVRDEAARRRARRKYTRIVMNDFMMNPGPSARTMNADGEEVEPDGEQFGLMAEFVSRWQGRLPEALASAAGTEIQIPPGNEDLIQIADQFDTQ